MTDIVRADGLSARSTFLTQPGAKAAVWHSKRGVDEMPLGFRIARRRRKVDATLVERFRPLPVANVSDSMSRMAAAGPRLRPMHAGGAIRVVACPVRDHHVR